MDTPTPPGPRPEPPLPGQCCGTACDPCIWTYHHRALERWRQRVADWEQAGGADHSVDAGDARAG